MVLLFPYWGSCCFYFVLVRLRLADCERFCPSADGPDEAQQFTSDCCNDLSLVLAGSAQFHIALVQAVLRFPRNLFDLLRNALLSSAQSIPDSWWTTIAPGYFDNDSSQVRVAGFRDASSPDPLATGVLAGHSAAITHQLPSTVKAGYLAQLGCDGHSRDICDAAQCLQIVDHLF